MVEEVTVRLPTQVFVSHTTPEPGKIDPVTMAELFWKPREGGLWTSSLDDEGGQWVRWLTGEGYSLEDGKWGGKLWLLEPREANVYVIHGPEELLDLVRRYPHPSADEYAMRHLESLRSLVDWPRVGEEYDAVTIPNPWPWRFGLSNEYLWASMFFYSLDAESTFWFRWCFEDEPQELDPAQLTKEE